MSELNYVSILKIEDDITSERERQNDKWGEQRHRWGDWSLILTEEVGEFCQEALRATFRVDGSTHLKQDLERMRAEMLHVAAVAVQIMEHLDETIAATKEPT